jgi:hypothetical protein
MGPAFDVTVPLLLVLVAVLLGRRELRLYRASHDEDSDLFVYSRGRLHRRLAGVVVLASTGLTLGAMAWLPAISPRGTAIYVALLTTEVLALIAIPILDLIETTRRS